MQCVGRDRTANVHVFRACVGRDELVGRRLQAVAQELSLTLPEFPRLTDATIDDFGAAEPAEGPFAALASLRKNTEC